MPSENTIVMDDRFAKRVHDRISSYYEKHYCLPSSITQLIRENDRDKINSVNFHAIFNDEFNQLWVKSKWYSEDLVNYVTYLLSNCLQGNHWQYYPVVECFLEPDKLYSTAQLKECGDLSFLFALSCSKSFEKKDVLMRNHFISLSQSFYKQYISRAYLDPQGCWYDRRTVRVLEMMHMHICEITDMIVYDLKNIQL